MDRARVRSGIWIHDNQAFLGGWHGVGDAPFLTFFRGVGWEDCGFYGLLCRFGIRFFSKSREVEYKTREKGTTRYSIKMIGHSSVKIGFAYSEKRMTRRHISYWCHYFVHNEETQAVGWATSRGGGDLHPLYRFRCIGVLLLQLHNVRVHFKYDISQWYKPGEWGTENDLLVCPDGIGFSSCIVGLWLRRWFLGSFAMSSWFSQSIVVYLW